jgi:hypothetical protein
VCPEEIDATVVAGGRLYLFVMTHSPRANSRATFDAFAETIQLHPEDATEPSTSPSPSP